MKTWESKIINVRPEELLDDPRRAEGVEIGSATTEGAR